MSFNAYAKSNGTARMMALVLAFVALFGFSAFGQEVTGSLTGTVVDPSGAAIPNAKVEVTGAGLPQGLVGTTNSTGNYAFNNVPAGAYTVTATVTGFSSMKKTDVNVVLGRSSQLNFKLEVGQVTESVVVSADAVMVDTTTSASSVNVDKSFFDLLPKGRSFYDLAAIAPGARVEGKTGGVQVDGASGSENTFFIDGMEVTNIQTGVLNTKNRIPVEMVQQTQIKNGVMEAQYGGAMGGVISAVVRSGSNDFHGQAGLYFNNDEMAGRPRDSLRLDPFDETRGEYFRNEADDYKTLNPVFNIAGPIVRNKLFFFSGFMPTKTTTNRDVTFNSDGKTRSYSQNSFQHYMTNKLDYMAFTKLRTAASWTWNPGYTQGVLPSRGGTDDPANDWAGQGGYDAGQIFAYSADYLATSKLVFSFRGGYHYTNHNGNYAIPNIMSIYYSGASRDARIPAALQGPAGYTQFAPGASFFDKYKRHNYNADFSYLGSWMGQHNIKGGWQMNKLANEVLTRSWANGYLRYYWFNSYTCVTSQCSGRQTGNFGYARYREYGETGNVSSNNQALFFQDTWRVNKYLTLNLGLRTEREFVPSFATATNIPSKAIEFPWSQKISPRLGFALDPSGDGKQRVYASWGRFFDVMKYELPRGSFGGNVYYDYYYTLDDATAVTQNTSALNKPGDFKGGKFLEYVNWRIPSNDPDANTIDPDLKPMQQQMFDVGYERSLSSSLVASARYTNRRLVRTIEDVGTLGPDGEIYYISNPGEGITVDPKTWSAGFPVTPKPVRNYDALELRLDKRFSKSYQFAASYTWSRSYGNYSGLASSDEMTAVNTGRSAPNVNRYFDLPWIYYTEQGKFAEGRLATDRPHTFKFFGGYTLNSKLGSTTFSPNFAVYSGTPITSEAALISSTPGTPYGRGDLGRTPIFSNVDLNVMHDFKPFTANEALKFRVELTIFNALNTNTVVNNNSNLLHENDGYIGFDNDADVFKGYNTRSLMATQGIRLNPYYGWANAFQAPRSLRLQLSFFF